MVTYVDIYCPKLRENIYAPCVQSGLPPTPGTITKACAIVFDTLGLNEADLINTVVEIPP